MDASANLMNYVDFFWKGLTAFRADTEHENGRIHGGSARRYFCVENQCAKRSTRLDGYPSRSSRWMPLHRLVPVLGQRWRAPAR